MASLVYTLDPNAEPPGLMISEFMADNKKTLHDEDGDSSDWIEVFNAGRTTATHWLLPHHPEQHQPVAVPERVAAPEHYLVLFASEKNRTDPDRPAAHRTSSWRRRAATSPCWIPAGKTVSEFTSYPPQLRDVSYGRDRANPNSWLLPETDPGSPEYNRRAGFFTGGPVLASGRTFTGHSAGADAGSTHAVIRYTLDGSLPTSGSPVYSGPIPVSTTVQVRAMSFAPGCCRARRRSESYLALGPDVVGFSSDLPVVVIHNFQGICAGRDPAVRQYFGV